MTTAHTERMLFHEIPLAAVSDNDIDKCISRHWHAFNKYETFHNKLWMKFKDQQLLTTIQDNQLFLAYSWFFANFNYEWR